MADEDRNKLPYMGGATVLVNKDLQIVLATRKETETLRDLWYSAKCKRDKLSDRLANNKAATREVQQPLNIWPTNQKVAYITAQPTKSPRLKNRRVPADQDSNLQPDRYYTSVTRRGPQVTPKFDALLRSHVPLPKLFDVKPPSRSYEMKSLESWKNQIVKVVPPRPQFSVPAKGGEMRPWAVEVSDDFQVTNRPHFYSASKAPVTRHFYVSPEWISEKVALRTGKAYRSNVVFG